jgi:type II secretory pathway component PulF
MNPSGDTSSVEMLDYADRRHGAILARPVWAGWAALHWVVMAAAWAVVGAAIVGAWAFAVSLVSGSSSMSVGSLVGGLLVLAALAALARGSRRARATTVLGYVEQAARLNLPLPPMLRAAARAEPRLTRRALDRVRERLEDGYPVTDALSRGLPGLPPASAALLRAGERVGRLPQGLNRALAPERRPVARDPSSAILLRWYPMVLIPGTAVVIAMYVVFVLPKYNQILHDFHLQPPAVMRWAGYLEVWAPFLAIGAGLLVLSYLFRSAAELLAPRMAARSPFRGLTDRLVWPLPLVGAVARHRALADVLHLIADALESGHTFEAALLEAAPAAPNAVLRRKLNRWADAATRGLPPADAARAAGMPALLVGLLAAAPAGNDVPRVLRFLARYHESRFSRSAELLRAVLVPGLALTFGTIVATLALAAYLPMIRLIDTLSNSPMPTRF